MDKFCEKCGQILPENARFCFECGTKVEQELICSVCGAKMPVGYKYCMECGSILSDSGKLVEKGQSDIVHDEVDWGSILSMIEDEESNLEELRNDIKNRILDNIEKWDSDYRIYVEMQKNVIWTGPELIDLRDLSTIEEMKKHIKEDLNSGIYYMWKMCWPQWEMYYRELDYSTSWVGMVYGNTFYYITREEEATLHKREIGTGNKEDIKTWSEVQFFKDEEDNLRILAHNLQEGGSTKEWILLDASGEVLWEGENASALRVGEMGWAFDYWPREEDNMYNSSLLLDFYTGHVLLKKYCDYSYYTNKKTGEIIIAADKVSKNCKLEFPDLYHYKKGEVLRFTDEEIERYGISGDPYKVKIPQFKKTIYASKVKETKGILTKRIIDRGETH